MEKGRVEKEKGKGILKKEPSFLQKLCSFLQNKSVSGSSFSFLPPETRQV